MNKVLITGLGIGKSLGVCDSCNMNYDWLLVNPSILLWADKLCVLKSLYHDQVQRDQKDDKAINLLLEMLEAEKMIEKVDIENIYTEEVGDKIFETALEEQQKMTEMFSAISKVENGGVPNEIVIEGNGYCAPYIASLYAGIKIANDIGANCLMLPRDKLYLKYKYGLAYENYSKEAIQIIYNEIFKTFLPNKSILPKYAFLEKGKCSTCEREIMCKESYLKNFEKDIKEVLKWRDYDEIYQIKQVIEKITREKNLYGKEIVVDEIVNEFAEQQKKIKRNINKRFPQIKRWTNLITIVSSPFTMYSAATGNVNATIASAAAAGTAKIFEKALDTYESENNWVSFYENACMNNR